MVDLTALQTARQAEAQETERQEATPSPETEAELDRLSKALTPGYPGFTPIPTNIPFKEQKSIFGAAVRQTTEWGALATTHTGAVISGEVDKNFDPIRQLAEDDLLEHAGILSLTKNKEQYDAMVQDIQSKQNDDELLAAHPFKGLLASTAAQFLSPANYLFGTGVFNEIKAGSRVLKAMAGGAIGGAGSAALQEAVLQANQVSRTAQESQFNILASGILGSVLTGAFTARGAKLKLDSIKRERAHRDIVNTLTDKVKDLTDKGLITDEDLANLPELLRKAMPGTSMNRLVKSPFAISKYFSNTMYESNYTLNKHLKGETDGASVETAIKVDKQSFASVLIDYQNIYFEMNGIASGPFKKIRAGLNQAEMNFEAFDDAVSHVLTTKQPHQSEHVNQAAKILRDKVFDPIKDQLTAEGLLPEGINPLNAEDYFMIVFNKNLIKEQGGVHARGDGTFPQALFDGYKAIQNRIAIFKESPAYRIADQGIKERQESLKGLPKEERIKIDKQISGVKKTIKDLEKRKAERPKEEIKKLAKEIQEHEKKIKELEESKTLDKAEKKKLEEEIKELEQQIKDSADPRWLNSEGELWRPMDDATLWGNVESTVDNILGHQEGQLLNPILQNIKGAGGKPLAKRKIPIDQVTLRDWHIKSASKVTDMYIRATVPMIHLNRAAKKFGANDLSELKTKISELLMAEYKEKSKGLTGKAALKLEKEMRANAKDMTATFDLLQGVYGDGPNVLNDTANKFYNNFLKWNQIRLLGGMTLLSIPDVAFQVIANGPFQTVFHGILPLLRGMRSLSKEDLRLIGYVNNTVLGTRIKSFSEHETLSTNPGPFSRAFDSAVQGFGNASVMNQWNDTMQLMTGTASIHRTLNTIHKIVNGEKVRQKDVTRLARLNLESKHFETIAKFTEGKVDEETGTRFADWGNWDIKTAQEAEALKQFQYSVGKDIDSIILVPGLGDKPLFAQTPLGKMILQFKSFLMAATNRTLFSSIQRYDDMDVYLGVISALALGSVSYMATSLAKDRKPDLSFENMAMESIDRSGVLGIFMEVYNVGNKFIGGTGTSRYYSRGIAGSMLGPSGGAIDEIAGVMQRIRGATTGDRAYTTNDAEKDMRFVPYQNLFYLERLNRMFVRKMAVGLGAEDVPTSREGFELEFPATAR
jgi:hypothetical protein